MSGSIGSCRSIASTRNVSMKIAIIRIPANQRVWGFLEILHTLSGVRSKNQNQNQNQWNWLPLVSTIPR